MKVCDIYSVTIYRHSLQEMHTSTMCLTHTESFLPTFFSTVYAEFCNDKTSRFEFL